MRRVSEEEKRETIDRQTIRVRDLSRAPRTRAGAGETTRSRCASALIAAL